MSSSDTQPMLQIQGTAVPALGFGTWQITGRECEEAVRDALDIGYRHIDTARAYENEAEVGAGLAGGAVAREEIFLTTKIPPDDAAPTDVVSTSRTRCASWAPTTSTCCCCTGRTPTCPSSRRSRRCSTCASAG